MKKDLKSSSKRRKRSSRRLRQTKNATETSTSGTAPDATSMYLPLEPTSNEPALEHNQSPSSMERPTTSTNINTEAILQSVVGQSVFGLKTSPESEGDVSRMVQHVHASGPFNHVEGVQLNLHGASDTTVAHVTRQVLQQQQKGPLQSSTPPPAPRMCFGRDDYISEAVALIKSAAGQSINIPILGAGGMGKTTTALSILHHDDIKTIFGDRRYFVACEAATTAGLLLSSIVQVLDYGNDVQQDPLTRMFECLNAGPVLLVIDNVETSWDTDGKVEVERLLEQISSGRNVALLVTMRGTVCPAPQISWTMIGGNYVLQTMTLEAARALFLHVVQRLKGHSKDDLDRLLKELDGVPLAVYLMAELGNNKLKMGMQASKLCQQMIKDWEKSATSMLKRGHNSYNRLTSVEVSISLSLDAAGSDAMTVRCMAILARLPDGVFDWLDTFHDLAPKIPRDIAEKLVDYALLYIDAVGTLRMLSPIRHYTLSKWNTTPADMAGLERFYANVMKINTVDHGPDHLVAIDCLNQHIGNISAVMTSIGHEELSLELMDIAQGAMGTLSIYGPSVLQKYIVHAVLYGPFFFSMLLLLYWEFPPI